MQKNCIRISKDFQKEFRRNSSKVRKKLKRASLIDSKWYSLKKKWFCLMYRLQTGGTLTNHCLRKSSGVGEQSMFVQSLPTSKHAPRRDTNAWLQRIHTSVQNHFHATLFFACAIDITVDHNKYFFACTSNFKPNKFGSFK